MGGGSKESDWPRDSHYERSRDNERQRNYRSFSSGRRSSDYRTEDSYSRNDDYDYDRNYRNDYHRSRDYRERDRRSRSRSRSFERDNRNYEYDSGRSYERSYEEKDRSFYKEKKEVPNNTLMVRNLPLHFTDKDVSSEINKFGLFPKDVRLMKNKETGQSRGFAFIEFSNVEQATQLKEQTKGCIIIENEHECTLHYSFPKDGTIVDKNGIKNDWSCPKCGINNFKRRDECFKCGTNKDDVRELDKNEPIQPPSNLLLLRNLPSVTTEERILTVIGTLTKMPIKSIRIVQDQYNQKNVCTLELHSVYEATQLLNIINSISGGFVIDDSFVSLSYGQRTEHSVVTGPSSFSSQNAAMAALAAAQWKNLDDASLKTNSNKVSLLGTVNINGVEHTKYPLPDYKSFQFDATTGYHYDHSTGFHYDSNSQYFFNSQTQKYMYYDHANQIYLTVDSTGKVDNTASISISKNEISKKDNEKQDKVKIAKKIAKDMEKWAKTLNQKKEISKTYPQAEFVPIEVNETEPVDIDCLLEQPISFSEPYSSEKTVNDPFEIIQKEEERLTDWQRMACLLCKRQFNTTELLTKHRQLSDLHKTNLNVLRQSLLSEEQLHHLEEVERELAYRDRAKERRDKFGIDDSPEFPKQKLKPEDEITDSAPVLPISDNNIGSKMLKAMGWTEGTGLGKSNQGTSSIINVERRKEGFGLGSNNATITSRPGETYKDAVRRTAFQRFKELSDN